MTTYAYKALTPDGTEVRGVLQAVDEYAAVLRIREKCPIITSIKPVQKKGAGSILTMELGSPHVRTKALALMCSQFAITLKSGMPIGKAMEMIAKQTEDKKLRKILLEAAEDVAGGNSVAASFEKFKKAFPLTFIETIRAGEESGTLENSFEKMQGYYEKTYKTTEKVKGAMAYPIFVVLVAVVVLIIIMAKVVPTLASTFVDLGGELPFITKLLIGISDFFAKWWMLMLIVLLALVIGWKLFTRTEKGRMVEGGLQLSFPVSGKINMMNGSAQFANTMAVMLGSGLTLNHAVEVTAKVLDNYLHSEDVRRMQGRIEQGRPLGECIRECAFFPGTLKEMCAVGEETGELDDTLEVIGEYFTNEADQRTQQAVGMLEPALLICLAFFAGFIVLAVYLPIFTMYDLM